MATEIETPLNNGTSARTTSLYGTNVNSRGATLVPARYSSQENLVPDSAEQNMLLRLRAQLRRLVSLDTENGDNRRTLTTISGVVAPVALSMFGTLLFQRIG